MGWKGLKSLKSMKGGKEANTAYTSSSGKPFEPHSGCVRCPFYVLQTLLVIPPSQNLSHYAVIICSYICLLNWNCKPHAPPRGWCPSGQQGTSSMWGSKYLLSNVSVKKEDTLRGLLLSFLPLVLWRNRKVKSCEKTHTKSRNS